MYFIFNFNTFLVFFIMEFAYLQEWSVFRPSGKLAGQTVGLSGDRLVGRPFCLRSKGYFSNYVSFLPLVVTCGRQIAGNGFIRKCFQ